MFCYDNDITEHGAEENMWTKEELSKGRLEKTA
jgi:hypothetical protein